MNNNKLFCELREKYNTFRYVSFEIEKSQNSVDIAFNFVIDGLCSFRPTIKIDTENLKTVNDFDSDIAKKIIFNLGMVELISYWKSACPPKVVVECGALDKEDVLWWKKLYFGGLGEFFYTNGIDTNAEDFMQIEALQKTEKTEKEYINCEINLIPIGGGKDSVVTTELMKKQKEKNMFFTVNDQEARTQCVLAAGYSENDILKTYRTIDKNLLRLNAEGFLNGHTPFSAIVAFLSMYCAYLIGASDIVLSNESSANESNIDGTQINHQYSKSYEFELDFSRYVEKNILADIKYFSILRTFNELQIAKYFSKLPQYHGVFKSCNAGSKKNIWCCNCAKCLFVYSILSAFLTEEKLIKIFGENLFEKESLKGIFDGLIGISDVKPFECIGTKEEINFALARAIQKQSDGNACLPFLLKYFKENRDIDGLLENKGLLSEFNETNNIPSEFLPLTKEMYDCVSNDD